MCAAHIINFQFKEKFCVLACISKSLLKLSLLSIKKCYLSVVFDSIQQPMFNKKVLQVDCDWAKSRGLFSKFYKHNWSSMNL